MLSMFPETDSVYASTLFSLSVHPLEAAYLKLVVTHDFEI